MTPSLPGDFTTRPTTAEDALRVGELWNDRTEATRNERPETPCDAERGLIDVLGVRPAWRRRGIGRALLLHAFGAFSRRGVRPSTPRTRPMR